MPKRTKPPSKRWCRHIRYCRVSRVWGWRLKTKSLDCWVPAYWVVCPVLGCMQIRPEPIREGGV